MALGKVPLASIRAILGRLGVEPSLDANTLEGDLLASTNPAIGVPIDALGFFAFHYSASNVAVAFARPAYATLSLTMPPGSPDEDVERVLNVFAGECGKYGVKLVAGHTARYEGVEYPLAVSTVVGKRLRERKPPSPGDSVYLVGAIGAESAWLLGHSVPLDEMTPLRKALALQESESVKFLHDVSEGGVLGALVEVSVHFNLRIEASAEGVNVHPALPRGLDPFLVPTYGALLAFTSDPSGLERWCESVGLECTRIGRVTGGGVGVAYGSKVYTSAPTPSLVELYNPYTPGSPELAQVALAVRELLRTEGFEKLVPEVGVNIAYAKPNPRGPEDVAALEGRIVRTAGGLRVCGKPSYGASRHLAYVLLEASKQSPELRAAVNLKPDPSFLESLRSAGIEVLDVSGAVSPCPVGDAIARGARGRAFYYRGLPDLEPSLVILGRDPLELVGIIREALERKT